MSLLTIIQRLARETDEDEPSTVEDSTESWIKRYIDYVNEGYRISYQKAFKNQSAQTTGTITMTSSPKDISTLSIQKLLSLDVSGNYPITLLEFYEFQKKLYTKNNELPLDTSILTGIPAYASLFADKLYVYPAPNTSYILNYTAIVEFTKLEDDDDEPIIDDDTLVNYGRYKVFEFDGDQRESAAYANFQACLNNFITQSRKTRNIPAMIMPEDAY